MQELLRNKDKFINEFSKNIWKGIRKWLKFYLYV